VLNRTLVMPGSSNHVPFHYLSKC